MVTVVVPFCSPYVARAEPAHQCSAPSKLRFRFGLIADVQYADVEDASNFDGSSLRLYRGSLAQTRQAVASWNSLRPAPAFVVQLGDIIDGQNAGGYGQGLSMPAPQSRKALGEVMHELRQVEVPMYHCIGNHELYNFNWGELSDLLNIPSAGWKVSEGSRFYFSWCPHPGWRFIVLNPYQVSLMQDKKSPGYAAAKEVLNEYNPNNVVDGPPTNFFQDLSGRKLRYVPFNGGVGGEQLQWLRKEVVEARERKERIVVCSHLPMHPGAASYKTVAYDCEEVMKVLHEDGAGCVVAVLAGHQHRGGYIRDDEGVHHVTLQSPLEFKQGGFAWMDVYSDRVELVGMGAVPSRTLDLPSLHVVPTTATRSANL